MNIEKVDLTNQNQKIFAGFVLVGIIALVWYLLPSMIWFFTHLYIAIALAVPLIWIVCNPMLIWNISKQISWALTKKLIAGDKLGYMYRYHDYLLGKIAKLDANIQNVGAIRVRLQRRIGDLKNTVDLNKRQVIVYQEKKSPDSVIRTMSNKINIDTKQLDSLLPKVVNVQAQESYLKELYTAWNCDAEDLKYTLDAKAEEFKLLKELSEATGNASEFLKGNSEEYKIYKESLDQIEDSVNKYTANVENFERKVKPMLENISMERSVSEDEGLKLVEEFKKNSIDLKIK